MCGIYIYTSLRICAPTRVTGDTWDPISPVTWATEFGQRATGLLHGRGAVQKRPRPPGSVSKVAMGHPHWKIII